MGSWFSGDISVLVLAINFWYTSNMIYKKKNPENILTEPKENKIIGALKITTICNKYQTE